MAVGKEIRTKIGSIKNTQKITKAMQMVATSKMRKSQDRRAASRPFAEKIYKVIGHLAKAHPEYRHPFLQTRETKRVGMIVITSDRGLCGGLNVNLLREVVRRIRAWDDSGVELDLCTLGSKGLAFLRHVGARIVAEASQLGDTPHLEHLIGPIKVMNDAYTEGRIDELHIGYNEFVNTMTQKPVIRQLLPIQPGKDEQVSTHLWDYLYEPDAKEALDALLIRYVESLVYQALVENNASEQAARMIAMRSATDNAGELIDELQLVYNKARQAAITQELSEIVGGAAAV
jgi:F-type H+-transporting ATPase subunit gamma